MLHCCAAAFLGTFCGLGGLVLAESFLRSSDFAPDNSLLYIPSFGALSTLLYAAPAAPLGKPKNTYYGHVISITIALAVHYAAQQLGRMGWWALPVGVEKVLTPSLAIAAMVLFKVAHPPAAACVIVYATLADQGQQMPTYLLMPALISCTYMLAVQRGVAAVMNITHVSKTKPDAPHKDASIAQNEKRNTQSTGNTSATAAVFMTAPAATRSAARELV